MNCLAILIQMSCASAPRSRSQPLTAFIFPSIWPSIPSARNAGAGSRANIKTIAAIAVRLFHGITLIMLKSLSLINPFPPRIHGPIFADPSFVPVQAENSSRHIKTLTPQKAKEGEHNRMAFCFGKKSE